jgi:hypothetical protein
MAETVRAEKRRLQKAAPTARRDNAIAAARVWREQKRRAWDKARPVFEGAFGRQFAPGRFTYERGVHNRNQFIKLSMNFEGKLRAFVKVYNEKGVHYLYVRPLNVPEAETKSILVPTDRRDLYGRVAELVEEWGLA